MEDVAIVEDVAGVEDGAGVDDTTAPEAGDELAAGVELGVDFGAEGTFVVDSGSLIPQTASASKGPKGILYALQLVLDRSMASLVLSVINPLGH